jgi:hypothetical protein
VPGIAAALAGGPLRALVALGQGGAAGCSPGWLRERGIRSNVITKLEDEMLVMWEPALSVWFLTEAGRRELALRGYN